VWDLKLNCASLEILWASHNLIEDLDINSSKYLRVLLLNNNKINELPKLKLYNLEELNLSKNQLKSLKNLDELILLKKLNFSNNRLESIDEKLIYLYLNELNLSHNYITKLNLLFLPCLEHLYLNNNRI
jgi:Leucine-rich repeat (LRR) protein